MKDLRLTSRREAPSDSGPVRLRPDFSGAMRNKIEINMTIWLVVFSSRLAGPVAGVFGEVVLQHTHRTLLPPVFSFRDSQKALQRSQWMPSLWARVMVRKGGFEPPRPSHIHDTLLSPSFELELERSQLRWTARAGSTTRCEQETRRAILKLSGLCELLDYLGKQI